MKITFKTMFDKKDRVVVEITIQFNITAIGEWLKGGGKFEDIDKLKRDWKDAVIQKYVIDMLPIGQSSNAYFHRSKGIVSQNISGIDYLENAKEDIKYIAEEKEAKIERLSWDMWRGCLGLYVGGNDKISPILLTPPLTEVVELETTGKLRKHEKASGDLVKALTEEIEIDVPYSFHNNKPKKSMKVWRRSACDRSLGYVNALGLVSFSTLNFEVEY